MRRILTDLSFPVLAALRVSWLPNNSGLDLRAFTHFVVHEEGRIQSLCAFWDESCMTQPEGMDFFVPDMLGHDFQRQLEKISRVASLFLERRRTLRGGS
jgi:hypothetical protein